MLENKIIGAAIQSRDTYDKLNNLLEENDLTALHKEIWDGITAYYSTDETAQEIDVELLSDRLANKLPKHEQILRNTLSELPKTSPANLLDEVGNLKKGAIANSLAGLLVSNPSNPKIQELYEKFDNVHKTLESKQNVLPVKDEIKTVLTRLSDKTGLIPLYPKSLNERCDGGAIRGHNIVIFARPNSGKTALLLTMSTGFIRAGYKVLYLINEDPREQLIQRSLSCVTGLDKHELYKDPDNTINLAEEKGIDNLYIEDINPGTFKEIRTLIESIEPDIVIIDQLRNLDVGAKDNKVLQLEKAAQGARDLAKRYNILVISSTQAGDSADNKLVLDMGDVDFSNTGVPGAVDLLLGIGVNQDYNSKGMRMLSIAKNKLGSDESYFPVVLNKSNFRFNSIY